MFTEKKSRQNIYVLVSKQTKESINPLSENPTKWSNTLKQFVRCCPHYKLLYW